jgi:8-amino-7-oxononanoate synthase
LLHDVTDAWLRYFQEQAQIQTNVKYFFRALLEQPDLEEALDEGLISVPLLEEWEERRFHSHVVPLKVRRPGLEKSLFTHLLLANINAYPIAYPVVPKGTALIRLVFHAHNTKEDIDHVLKSVGSWAIETLMMERGESKHTLTSAQRQFMVEEVNGWK